MTTKDQLAFQSLEDALKHYYGFTSFRPLQKEIIQALLAQKDVLALLPTGTGKSLCYQLAGYLLEGLVVIISPLVSLMEDQVNNLWALGEKRVVALNSLLDKSEKAYVLAHLSNYKFLFLSPEMASQEAVIQSLSQQKIALLVIDEAHCISQWGVDFRPEYRNLHLLKESLQQPLTLALTASATQKVKEELTTLLLSNQPIVFEQPIDRQNIFLKVMHVTDKFAALTQLLTENKGAGIIYCATRKRVEALYQQLKSTYQVAYYHGGLAGNQRQLLQAQFKANQLQLLIATNAFGMGIDKADIRFVIHYELPDSLENYVQEIGRAGRDGQQSQAILLYQEKDEQIHYFLQEQQKNARKEYEAWYEQAPALLNAAYLSEQQLKWQQQIQKEGYAAFMQRLKDSELTKRQMLKQMLAFIHTQACRRQWLADYFNNEQPLKPKYCCDIDTQEVPNLAEQSQREAIFPDTVTNWQAIFKKIFKTV
ncbi:RecQ family ATP-dependent DNA helicase [Enterococcus columbae]|uniref:ATP-dependent DNA helicase RecQ n=1 Tax=Enterococcus columbae DSM 7374 = ATCC 51263 TaxID=1121865 RepID=S0KNA3_9ENTE|nr:ATP-dependent DNA helicase RecQ [Enterococcus columbae]EOT42490.1 hypothetical protein OMW_00968 [Enterococcus columbae DSM 7374 = ATCC 51263]EOW87574.1 hypothetical protein I568_00239 [Enterococcus columbae DSM 7374 = ATCC 51263]OJG23129.1 hypothetical protein RR47_GL000619 [Enterococcus columbae DSM 7374 = ATCC 51263]